MRRVLHIGSQTIELMRWQENPTADTYLEFRDALSALDFLHTFMPDPLSMMTLRHSLNETLSSTNIAGLDDQEVLELLAGQLVDGSIRVMPFAPSQPTIQGAGHAQTATDVAEKQEEEEQATPTAVEQRTSWIEIKLIDEESSPIAGEKYRIVLPGGSIMEGQLDSDGKARIERINPGTCKVSFPELNARAGLNT